MLTKTFFLLSFIGSFICRGRNWTTIASVLLTYQNSGPWWPCPGKTHPTKEWIDPWTFCLEIWLHFSISCSSFSSPSSVLFLHLRRIGLTPVGTLMKREDPVVLCRELELVFGLQHATQVNIYLDYSSILTVELEIDIRSTIHPSTSQFMNCVEIHVYDMRLMVTDHCLLDTIYIYIKSLCPLLHIGHYVSDGEYLEGGAGICPDCRLTYDDDRVSETTGTAVCLQRQRSSALLFCKRQVMMKSNKILQWDVVNTWQKHYFISETH